MVSRTRERAQELAARFPEAREPLLFVGAVLAFHGDWSELRALVAGNAPAPLRDLAGALTEIELQTAVDRYLRGQDRQSPSSFFARVMLRANPPRREPPAENRCPHCGEPPQCGCLHPEGHGSAFFLVCSLCAREWRFPRARCPECAEAAVFYSSDRMSHVQTQICEHCRRYFHVIDLVKEPQAIPLLDEVGALTLDLWAIEGGFQKIHPNLAGI